MVVVVTELTLPTQACALTWESPSRSVAHGRLLRMTYVPAAPHGCGQAVGHRPHPHPRRRAMTVAWALHPLPPAAVAVPQPDASLPLGVPAAPPPLRQPPPRRRTTAGTHTAATTTTATPSASAMPHSHTLSTTRFVMCVGSICSGWQGRCLLIMMMMMMVASKNRL